MHSRIVSTLILIASAPGAGCATTAHAQHEATPPDMAVTIEQDGSVSASHLVESSNFSRLDAACENAFPEDVRFIPATKDGNPIKATVIIPIVWCLGVGCSARMR